MKDKLTVIIPVDRLDEVTKPLFDKAVESVHSQAFEAGIIVVGPKAEIEKVKDVKGLTLEENEDINLPKQVNTAVNEVKTEYFTVLEYDDTFTKHWFANVEKYGAAYPEVSIYLPINEVFDFKKNNEPIGYLNEPVWASSFSEKLGYFDNDSLMNYVNVNCTGGVINKDMFLEIGGLKESIKLSFWYEFILRANYKAKEIFVIPKVGLKHGINRDGSLLDTYAKTMTPEESDWWLKLAREEYFFKKDRKKVYQK